MKRRSVLKATAGLLTANLISGCGSDTALGSNAVAASRTNALQATLGDNQSVQNEVQRMVDFGPRYTGSAAHRQFIDYLDQEFQAAGLTTSRDPYPIDEWIAEDSSLTVKSDKGTENIPIDSLYPRSASTSATGVEGPLRYVGVPLQFNSLDLTALETQSAFLQNLRDQLGSALLASLGSVASGLRGAIAVIEVPLVPLTLGLFYPFATLINDKNKTLSPLTDYKRSWVSGLFVLEPLCDLVAQAGAAGVIFVLDSSAENTQGQYLPFSGQFASIPAFLVNRVTGNRLKRLANNATANMRLVARKVSGLSTDTLVATLPGVSDEVIVINTHTDGPNVCEEDGAVGCLMLARYFAKIPLSQRPRTLVFSMLTGHMAPNMPQGDGFIEAHPDIMQRCVAVVTLEHLGMREWLDDEAGYHSTNRPEPAVLFHSNTGIADAAVRAARETALDRLMVCKPLGVLFFGVGLPFQLAGYPCLAYISGPNYLVASEPDHGMSRFDAQRMADELRLMINAIHVIEETSAASLKIGDSSLIRAVRR